MDLGLSDEQAQLVASLANLLAKCSSPEQVRAAEPTGFDPVLWSALHEVGMLAMVVPEAAGGWGASTVDLALAAEQVGRALAPAPVIEAQAAVSLLAALGCDDLVADALTGGRLVTLAVRPAEPEDASRAELVPAAAVADVVVVRAGDRLLRVDLRDDGRRTVANLGALPLADFDLSGAEVVASGPEVVAAFDRSVDLWLTLTANAVVGIGARAHEITCAYASERRAFGSPIGSFQGIAHPLADSRTALDGALLLARKAAWAVDVGHPRRAELAAMAFAFASESARDATYHAVHVHGGYGFMLETDVQLFYRRARAWARVWGEPALAYRRAARARYAGVEAGVPVGGGGA